MALQEVSITSKNLDKWTVNQSVLSVPKVQAFDTLKRKVAGKLKNRFQPDVDLSYWADTDYPTLGDAQFQRTHMGYSWDAVREYLNVIGEAVPRLCSEEFHTINYKGHYLQVERFNIMDYRDQRDRELFQMYRFYMVNDVVYHSYQHMRHQHMLDEAPAADMAPEFLSSGELESGNVEYDELNTWIDGYGESYGKGNYDFRSVQAAYHESRLSLQHVNFSDAASLNDFDIYHRRIRLGQLDSMRVLTPSSKYGFPLIIARFLKFASLAMLHKPFYREEGYKAVVEYQEKVNRCRTMVEDLPWHPFKFTYAFAHSQSNYDYPAPVHVNDEGRLPPNNIRVKETQLRRDYMATGLVGRVNIRTNLCTKTTKDLLDPHESGNDNLYCTNLTETTERGDKSVDNIVRTLRGWLRSSDFRDAKGNKIFWELRAGYESLAYADTDAGDQYAIKLVMPVTEESLAKLTQAFGKLLVKFEIIQ